MRQFKSSQTSADYSVSLSNLHSVVQKALLIMSVCVFIRELRLMTEAQPRVVYVGPGTKMNERGAKRGRERDGERGEPNLCLPGSSPLCLTGETGERLLFAFVFMQKRCRMRQRRRERETRTKPGELPNFKANLAFPYRTVTRVCGQTDRTIT